MNHKPWWEEQFYVTAGGGGSGGSGGASGGPLLGKRADFTYVDDISIQKEVNKRYKEEISKQLESWFLYGVQPKKEEKVDVNTALMNGLNKPSPIMNYFYSTGTNASAKEQEMEIGGNRCHLCGAEVLHASDNSTYLKKRVVSEKHLVYQCGTQILETKKAKYIYCSDSGRQEPEFERHIHAECI